MKFLSAFLCNVMVMLISWPALLVSVLVRFAYIGWQAGIVVAEAWTEKSDEYFNSRKRK